MLDGADPKWVALFCRMERFRPVRTTAWPDEVLKPYYYAGHLGTILSAFGAMTGSRRYPCVAVLPGEPHYRGGHLRVGLRLKTGRHIKRGAHALVLLAWVGYPSGEWEDGCHVNGVPTDNRLKNLMWGSRSLNAQQREEHRRARERDEAREQYAMFAEPEYEIDPEMGF